MNGIEPEVSDEEISLKIPTSKEEEIILREQNQLINDRIEMVLHSLRSKEQFRNHPGLSSIFNKTMNNLNETQTSVSKADRYLHKLQEI